MGYIGEITLYVIIWALFGPTALLGFFAVMLVVGIVAALRDD